MLFNSIEFAIFLPIVFLFYWLVFNKSRRNQNAFLLFASYVFYGWWDWRFLLLLFSVSLFNFFIGIRIDSVEAANKKKWLTIALIVNIGVLGVFKYFDFFIDGFIDLISLFGYEPDHSTLNIVLPLGISFYIFLSISYILDIFKKNLTAEKSIVNVLLTLGFFPIILAGPIQRPSTLLPQIAQKRTFSYDNGTDGMRQILWGLFMKIAVADNLAPYANDIFLNYSDYFGSTLLVGALFYTIQIYADFSGYSHIAIGTARLFGFRLIKNFDHPYLSRDIAEFWKKWHISLTGWFRDYVFLPLTFSISWKIKTERVVFFRTEYFIYFIASLITWFLTGLWHGANYTFILWGLLHGSMLIIYRWQRKPRARMFRRLKIDSHNFLITRTEWLLTFFFVMLTWVIFRSETVNASFAYLQGIFSASILTAPQVVPVKEILIAILFIIVEFIQRGKQHGLQIEKINNRFLRWGVYVSIVLIIILLGGGTQQFIYFQF